MMLLTKEIVRAFEKQGDTSQKSADEIKVICKLFNPSGAGTWYLYERIDEDIFMCFANLGDPQMAECGTVSLTELKDFRGMFGLGIERDRWFDIGEKTLQEVIDIVKDGRHV
jgi:hypothetical protein